MSHPYDELTPDRVVACMEAVGYRCDLRLLALNSYENRVYQVGLEDSEPVVVKFYRPERWSNAQIQEEHDYAGELADHGVSVVAPSPLDGRTLHEVEQFRFSVFPRRGGHPPELDNFDHLLMLGRTLGRIHRIGAAQPFEYRPAIALDDRLTDNRQFLLTQFVPSDLKPAFESVSRDCENELKALMTDYRPEHQIRLHGDCHVGNILWRDDVFHFVDLDDCVAGPAIQDLWMFLNGDRHQQELQLAELIAGYEEFNDFDPAQLKWVEALRTLRIMRHATWLARRWDDPAFPKAFPWFGQDRFWSDHILELREQLAAMREPTLRLL